MLYIDTPQGHQARRIFWKYLLDEICADFSHGDGVVNFLDFGCSYGEFIRMADYRRIAKRYTGIEVNRNIVYHLKLVNTARNTVFMETNEWIESREPHSIDVLTSIEVLPYISDITSHATLLADVLHPIRGVVYLVTGILSESSVAYRLVERNDAVIKAYPRSLDDILLAFVSAGFKCHAKRINLSDSFGIQLDPVDLAKMKIGAKEFLDYLFEDKILLKLTL